MSCHYTDDEAQRMRQDRDDELEYAYLWQLDMRDKEITGGINNNFTHNFTTKPKRNDNGTDRESF